MPSLIGEPEGKARRALSYPAIEQDGFIQILDGVKAGERVAARGAIFLDNAWQE